MNARVYRWENTHRMITQKGVFGMKTGVTNNAGPCLCTSVVASDKYPTPLIVVLLNSSSMDIRWMETWKLAKWAASRLSKIKQFRTEVIKPLNVARRVNGASFQSNASSGATGGTFAHL